MKQSWLSVRVLVISLLLTVLTASAALGVLFNWLFLQFSEEANVAVFQKEEAFISALATSLQDVQTAQNVVQHWQSNESSLSLTPLSEFPLPDVLKVPLMQGEVLHLESEQDVSLSILIPDGQHVLTMQVAVVHLEPDSALRLLLTSLFYVALLVPLCLWLYPLILRLLKLRQTAQKFGAGELSERVDVGSVSYIADIEHEFNQMAQRIENLVGDIKLLSSAVSHDLRTPLARIRFGIETMAEEDELAQRSAYQERIIRDVDFMVELVENLLDFARLEKSLSQSAPQQINLNEHVTQALEQHSHSDTTIVREITSEPVILSGDRTFVLMLINNLLGNALKFCEQQIMVSLAIDKQFAVLTIEDDGPGIPEAKRQDILQPFVRGQEQDRKSGFGLGLAVVKRITDFYGGRIVVTESALLGGACFTIRLPTTP